MLLKIIGFISLAVALAGIVFLVIGFGDFEGDWFPVGMFMTAFGFFGSFFGLITGFAPEIARASTQTAKYIQNENREALKDIANASADINKEAVATVASAVKDGLTDTVYCKHCGKRIDADSRFCSYCGGEQ